MPPLGYDVKNCKLVVNDVEAPIVVEIYRRYLALKSVHALRDELADAGIKSKRRMRPDGAEYGGQKFSRGALYLILQNRLYRGEMPHKGNSYPGEHPAIVDKPLWDDVQAVLAANRVDRATGARASNPSLLTGMVFDETGERLTPTYAVKKGTRYRYYVSTSLLTRAGRNRSSGRRIPAGNLESLVLNRIRTFLADPERSSMPSTMNRTTVPGVKAEATTAIVLSCGLNPEERKCLTIIIIPKALKTIGS
jgi:site-specific DNA recombinase